MTVVARRPSVLDEDRREEIAQGECGRAVRPGWMPRQHVHDQLRSLIVRRPALDEPSVEVHDPVVGHVSLIQRTFSYAIMPTARRRQSLDRQYDLADRQPLAHHSSPFVLWNNED